MVFFRSGPPRGGRHRPQRHCSKGTRRPAWRGRSYHLGHSENLAARRKREFRAVSDGVRPHDVGSLVFELVSVARVRLGAAQAATPEESMDAKTLRRLDVQGFDCVPQENLAPVAGWLRLPFALCAILAIIGTALASTLILSILAAIAFVAMLSPIHPFDLIYNRGIRHVRGTGPFPRRGAPARFACGLGSVWLVATILAFRGGMPMLGYILGFSLSAVAILVSTTNICIPSMIYRLFAGPPQRR